MKEILELLNQTSLLHSQGKEGLKRPDGWPGTQTGILPGVTTQADPTYSQFIDPMGAPSPYDVPSHQWTPTAERV